MRRIDLHNMLQVSRMLCKAALSRTESRGAHYRSDCPLERNPEWRKNILIRKGDGGAMTLEAVGSGRQEKVMSHED